MNTAAAVTAATGVLTNQEGWRQASELLAGLLLSASIGVEREIQQKNAGLRTHTLVGLGAALFMLISKYGFDDVAHPGLVILDPSRVAAQIVSGIGFIGAGLIFVRRDSVRGLTTAASIWVTAAVGAAAGAGLILLAAETTAAYLVVATAFRLLARHLPRQASATSTLRVRYPDGHGVLRDMLQIATSSGFIIHELSAESLSQRNLSGTTAVTPDGKPPSPDARPVVEVRLHVNGRYPVSELAAVLSEVDGVDSVLVGDGYGAAD